MTEPVGIGLALDPDRPGKRSLDSAPVDQRHIPVVQIRDRAQLLGREELQHVVVPDALGELPWTHT
jgi:hypothetical protein